MPEVKPGQGKNDYIIVLKPGETITIKNED